MGVSAFRVEPIDHARLYRRFAASTRGVAAIEFDMILTILATLFLASFDGAGRSAFT
jgi:Flp pilus assembly protein TadG